METKSPEPRRFMNKEGPEIRTSRLILRPLRDSDISAVHDIRSRKDVMVWSLSKLPDPDLATTLERLCHCNDEGNLAIVVLEISNQRLCGLINFFSHDGEVEIGYLIHPDVWGRGYATESLKAAIQAWWEGYPESKPLEYMPKELCAYTHAGNARSYRVLQKCGFTLVKEYNDEYGPGEAWKMARPGTTLSS